MKKLKRNAPLLGMLGGVAMFSTACTVEDVLNIIKIIGIFI